MNNSLHLLWLIPLLPLVGAGVTALLPRDKGSIAAMLAITAQGAATLLSLAALVTVIQASIGTSGIRRESINFDWLSVGDFTLPLGLLLDPLTVSMLMMVSLVSLLIFIFSLGYMREDPNRVRFFCFLSLFSAGMSGIVVSNSLLLLFVAWEIVGLSSYLLIGFWFLRPAAADAARKAFITTRIGDIGLLIGMIWLYAQSGSLLFYDGGAGCLETDSLSAMASAPGVLGLSATSAIAILIFCGAAGKSGQFPFHTWLPDAMEGPTPVSALIHAATMVAAGVFLVARVYPVFAIVDPGGGYPAALTMVTWIGAITALLGALIAVAQFDIKRILAYSTISQLGFMMLSLGVGGWPAAIAHLIAHAFFKALLFLGAGSVLHGTHHLQDIRSLGGLRRSMPWTFLTYSIGMMALAGFPFLFSGFWSKEAILHAAHGWPVSQVPFIIGILATFLTAFYMSRQMAFVFFGTWKGGQDARAPHESPKVMTLPLVLLSVCSILMALLLTPAWPWLPNFLTGEKSSLNMGQLIPSDSIGIILVSIIMVAAGVLAAWRLYAHHPGKTAEEPDPLEAAQPALFRHLHQGFHMDALYRVIAFQPVFALGRMAVAIDRWIIDGILNGLTRMTQLAGNLADRGDRRGFNRGFNRSCKGLQKMGRTLARTHTGHAQIHLRAIGIGVIVLLILNAWL